MIQMAPKYVPWACVSHTHFIINFTVETIFLQPHFCHQSIESKVIPTFHTFSQNNLQICVSFYTLIFKNIKSKTYIKQVPVFITAKG